MNFKYVWERNVPTSPLEKELILTSTATLTMNFTLKTSMPFSLSEENHYL